MRLILHTGVHYAEEDRLIATLLRNAQMLAERGVLVPEPGAFRKPMRQALNAMGQSAPVPGARDELLAGMLGDTVPDRIVLSDPNFFRTPGTALMAGVIYPDAPVRMQHMGDLFATEDLEIYMGLRNFAGLVPQLHAEANDPAPLAFWGDRRPQDLRWSDLLGAIREAAPEIPVTVWCTEDLPLLWGTVLREMAGLAPDDKITGNFDLLADTMTDAGMSRFRDYLETHGAMDEPTRRKVIATFLETFAVEDAFEEELDMPGWDAAMVDTLTALYDADLHVIQNIPGVRLLLP